MKRLRAPLNSPAHLVNLLAGSRPWGHRARHLLQSWFGVCFFLAQQGGRVIVRQAKLCFSSFFLHKIKSREKKEKKVHSGSGDFFFFVRLAFKKKDSKNLISETCKEVVWFYFKLLLSAFFPLLSSRQIMSADLKLYFSTNALTYVQKKPSFFSVNLCKTTNFKLLAFCYR